MSFAYLDTRQSINRSALSTIGTAANTSLDQILSQINAVIVTIGGTQTITGAKTFSASGIALTVNNDLQINGLLGFNGIQSNSVINIQGTPATTGTSQIGFLIQPSWPSSATTSIIGAEISMNNAASTTTTNGIGFQVNAISPGASSTILREVAFYDPGSRSHFASSNATLSDNVAFSNNWLINQSGSDPSILGGTLFLSTGSLIFENVGTASPGYIQIIHNTSASVGISNDIIFEAHDNNVNGSGGQTDTRITWSHGANSFLTTMTVSGTNSGGNGNVIANFLGNGTITLPGTTSGLITLQPQAAAGTYNWNWPITAGSAGQTLTSQGGGSTAMTWTSTLSNPMTATGDIIYSSNNAGNPTRLGIGTTGQILTVEGGVPTWQNQATLENLIINGNMDFFQRATSFHLASATNGTGYTADRWKTVVGGSTSKTLTVQQGSSPPNPTGGFYSKNTLVYDYTGPSSATLSTDFVSPYTYVVEGYDFQQMFNQTVTLGFWFNSSATGSRSVAFTNVSTVPLTTPSMTFNYVTTFNVTTANTWQYITIPVNFNSGSPSSWNFTNGAGMAIWIDTVAGINFSTTSLNTWNSGTAIAYTSSPNNTFTNGYSSAISQVSLVVGSTGLSSLGFSRAGTTIQEELAMCQRYYEKSYELTTVPLTSTNIGAYYTGVGVTFGANQGYLSMPYKVPKRTAATPIAYSDVPSPSANTVNASGTVEAVTYNFTSTQTFLLVNAAGGPVAGPVEFQWLCDADF